MFNFGASKPRVKGGAQAPGVPLDLHLFTLLDILPSTTVVVER